MAKIVIDKDTGIEKKEGWKVTTDLDELGQETVAQKIADAEGTSLEKAKEKLRKAKEDYGKGR